MKPPAAAALAIFLILFVFPAICIHLGRAGRAKNGACCIFFLQHWRNEGTENYSYGRLAFFFFSFLEGVKEGNS